MSQAQQLLAYLIALSGLAVALRAVSHRSHLPYPVVLAAAGIVVGLIPGGRPAVVGSDLILLAFVPGLVFQAAFTLRLSQLRRVLTPVGLLATVGVAVTVLGAGTAMHFLIGLSWSDGFLLAAILAPTDPVAVVSVLRAIRAPAAVTALLEGESLLNDGSGVAIFAALVASIASGAPSVGDVGIRFAFGTGIGLAMGLAWGGIGVAVLRATSEAGLEFLTTMTLAYGAYLSADVLHGSGIIAVVTAAILLVVTRRHLKIHGQELIDFWDLAGFVLNALLFLLIGTALPSGEVIDVGWSILLGFVALTVVRTLSVYGVLVASDWRARRIPWRARPLVVWGGMRGALSVALALSLRGHAGVDQVVVTIGYGIVLLSLLLQGGSVPAVIRLSRVQDRDK
jgi:NhaP-type Na+/H+ or K+/H+ antiporter